MSVIEVISGEIAHVVIDNPPVNAISHEVRAGLLAAVARLDSDQAVRAVILRGKGSTFVAGADVTEFADPPQPPHLPDVVAAIEGAAKPWAALIIGDALGGGLELALGCRWRLATLDSSLGLPEVSLGIIPGAGGTVRSTRLIGAVEAVALATSGKPVKVGKAVQLGLIDQVLSGDDPVAAASVWLERALTADLPAPVRARPVTAPDDAFWDEAAAQIAKTAKGNTAPLEVLASIRKAATEGFDAAMAHERATFLRLRGSDQAAALRYLFFAERAAVRPAELRGVTPRPLTRVGVVGGGTMGAGIAVAMRSAGLPVQMAERDSEAAARGRAQVEGIYQGILARGRMSAEQMTDALAGFNAGFDYADLAECDLVIEAVFEDLAVKRAVFAELTRVCAPDAVLATNTSYLNPEQIFEGMPGADRFIGLHFFSPANVMKLLEIVPTRATAQEVLAAGFSLAKRAGKIPVRTGICDGFIGNRILKLMRVQAERILLAGATPAQVDAALRAFGMAMGPFEAQDLSGLDIAAYQRRAARERGEPTFAPIADRLVTAGRLGRKSDAGWYDYTGGKVSPRLPDAVRDAITHARLDQGTSWRVWSEEAIIEAVILPMINEAAQIVQEGIALRPEDVDLVEIHGYGFPRFRGGPVQYGRALGFDHVAARLTDLHEQGLADSPCTELHTWAAGRATA